MGSEEPTISEDEMECLKGTLKRLGYLKKGDRLEPLGSMLTGVAGRSRVFIVNLSRPFGNRQRFVAKFDKDRTAKELLALENIQLTNYPSNFLTNIDGKSGLRKMPAENGLILYKAADSVTWNHKVLSFHQFLCECSSPSGLVHSLKMLGQVLNTLKLFYRSAVLDHCNDQWSDYFKVVEEQFKYLNDIFDGKDVKEGIGKINDQIGEQILAPIHGDLNLTNILVAMLDKKPKDVMFIDFADYKKKGPIVLDFVKMETELWLETASIHLGTKGQTELEKLLPQLIHDPSGVVCKDPMLTIYVNLSVAIRAFANEFMARTDFFASYGVPLTYAFLRALTYKSVKDHAYKLKLAKIGAEAAWSFSMRLIEEQNTSSLGGEPDQPKRSGREDELGQLVANEIEKILRKQCWIPFLTTLLNELNAGTTSDAPVTVAKLMMAENILDLTTRLASILGSNYGEQHLKKQADAWRGGLEIIGWLVIANVDENSCRSLRSDNFFRLPLKTLLGAEIVLARQSQRRANFKSHGGIIKGPLCMDTITESGPNSTDYVVTVACHICELMRHKVPSIWDNDAFKTVDAMLKALRKLKKPYYHIAFIEDKSHPLNNEDNRKELLDFLPNLMLIILEPDKAGKLNVILFDEHELTGTLRVYLEEQQNWLNHNSEGVI